MPPPLRNHQIDAREKFKRQYYENEETKGILSMCCGSGKTLTFYSIIKTCISKYNEGLFIYATSRILLVQSIVTDLFNWCYQDNLNLLILVKVSNLNKIQFCKNYYCSFFSFASFHFSKITKKS